MKMNSEVTDLISGGKRTRTSRMQKSKYPAAFSSKSIASLMLSGETYCTVHDEILMIKGGK